MIEAMGHVKFYTSQLEQAHEGDVIKEHTSCELIEAMGQVKFGTSQLEQSHEGDVVKEEKLPNGIPCKNYTNTFQSFLWCLVRIDTRH